MMQRAKIDEEGNLWLDRKHTFKQAACKQFGAPAKCGDWCAAFEEKTIFETQNVVRICSGAIYEIAEDERKVVE